MGRQILALIVVLCVKQVTSLQNTTLEPCTICNSLDRFISDVGGRSQDTCQNNQCLKSGKMQQFMRNANKWFAKNFISVDTDRVYVASTNDEDFAQVLTFAMLGAHLVKTVQDKDIFRESVYYFEYDVQKQTLITRKPLCAFQQSIYSALLVLSVVVILIGLSLQMIKENSQKDGQHHDGNTIDQASQPANNSIAFRSSMSPHVRYRLLQ